MKRVLTAGEPLGVVRTTGIGGIDVAPALHAATGGAELNVAIGLARLGVAAIFVGKVGEDSLGRLIERDLRANAVTTLLDVDPARPTGLLLKETPRSGSTRVTYYRRGSAGSQLRPSDVTAEAVSAADLVHTTGITSQISETAHATALHLARTAAEHSVPFAFDINHRSKLARPSAKEDYRVLAGYADIVFAGLDEARLLVDDTYDDPAELARAVQAVVEGDVVLKLGARGALVLSGDEVFVATPPPIEAVDTVGAGDALAAGYLSAFLEGLNPRECLARGVTTGALACTVPGDWEGSPRRQELTLGSEDDPVDR